MKKITISTRSMYEDLSHQWKLFCPFDPFPAHSVRYFLDRIISTAKGMYQDRMTEISRVKRNEILDPTTEIVEIENSLYYLMECLEDTLHMCQTYFFPLYQQKKIQYLLYKVEKKYWEAEALYFRSIEGEYNRENLAICAYLATGGHQSNMKRVPKKRFVLKRGFLKKDLN